MREIKFRVWDLQLNKYRTPGTMQMSCTGRLFLLVPNGNKFDVARIEDLVLQQFTGLKDKNGVDIYEGDIVKSQRGDWGVVVMKDHCFEITISSEQSSLYRKDYYNDSEIIGNIYETPELLN